MKEKCLQALMCIEIGTDDLNIMNKGGKKSTTNPGTGDCTWFMVSVSTHPRCTSFIILLLSVLHHHTKEILMQWNIPKWKSLPLFAQTKIKPGK